MVLLNEAVEEKKLDTRLVERNISRGVISAHDAQNAINELPDDSENADWISIDSFSKGSTEDNNSNYSYSYTATPNHQSQDDFAE